MRLYVLFLFVFCCVGIIPALAQQNYLLEVQCTDHPEFFKKLSYTKSFSSDSERKKELQKILWYCFDNGYLTAEIDSISIDSLNEIVFFYAGAQYLWAHLKKGNVDEGVLSEIGFREKVYNNKAIYFKDVKLLQEKLITYYENNGFPFAAVKLDSIVINENKITAQLKFDKNQEIKIDSIIINGDAKIAPVYLYNYLGIKPGSLYDESKIRKVNTRIAELVFLRATKPSVIDFTDKHTQLILNLEKKRASQFDGIVGVLPDNATKKIVFTGDVKLKLQNGLGRGELIELNWRRLQTQTQDLKLHLVYPFVLNTPFGIDYNLKIYKRDTTFLDVNHNIGLQYMFTGGNYFKVFYGNKTSSLLSTKGLEFITVLPSYADVSNNMYGMGMKYEKLDYRLNPRKGFSITSNGSVGIKDIKKNPKVNPVVYETLTLRSTQYNGDLEAMLFLPVVNRSTVKLAVQAAFIQGQTIFQNELYRIGGFKTLRGFNEETIFASTYSIFTLEYRFILEQNSYLYVFGDGAWYENNMVNTYVHDTPYGFGGGISFETKAGVFSISYALGKQFNNPILLRDGKIHFGIVNYF